MAAESGGGSSMSLTRIAGGGQGHMGTARQVSSAALGGVLGTEGVHALLHEGTQSQGSHHKTSEKENGMGVKMKWAKGVK